MHIGRHGNLQFRADRRQDVAALLDPDTSIRPDRRAIRLVVRRLENEWDRFRFADGRDPPRHPPDKLLRLDHAWPKDKRRLSATNRNGANFELLRFHKE